MDVARPSDAVLVLLLLAGFDGLGSGGELSPADMGDALLWYLSPCLARTGAEQPRRKRDLGADPRGRR